LRKKQGGGDFLRGVCAIMGVGKECVCRFVKEEKAPLTGGGGGTGMEILPLYLEKGGVSRAILIAKTHTTEGWKLDAMGWPEGRQAIG